MEKIINYNFVFVVSFLECLSCRSHITFSSTIRGFHNGLVDTILLPTEAIDWALVGSFNQKKALVGAFSVIVQLHRLIDLQH